MNDAILFITGFLIGYLFFVGVMVILFKIFFPFLSEAELEQRKRQLSLRRGE